MTIRDIYGLKKVKGDVGIEVELESMNREIYLATVKDWIKDIDGSLRGNSAEYKTNGSVKLADVKGLLDNLFSTNTNMGHHFDYESPRTSIHVHHNVSEFTPIQVWTSLAGMWAFEQVLLQLCNTEKRKGNGFCLTVLDRHEIVGIVTKAAASARQPSGFFAGRGNNRDRYCFTNIARVGDLGTIEMRGMEFTTDLDRADDWISGVNQMINYFKESFDSPLELADSLAQLKCAHAIEKHVTHDGLRKRMLNALTDELSFEPWVDSLALVTEFGYETDWEHIRAKCIKKNGEPAKLVGTNPQAFINQPVNVVQLNADLAFRNIPRPMHNLERFDE